MYFIMYHCYQFKVVPHVYSYSGLYELLFSIEENSMHIVLLFLPVLLFGTHEHTRKNWEPKNHSHLCAEHFISDWLYTDNEEIV